MLAPSRRKLYRAAPYMSRRHAHARGRLRAGARLRGKHFSFYGAVQEFEATVIEQALEEEGGRVTRAAKLLGLKHQTFISMLNACHRKLLRKRKPPEKRLRSSIKELNE